MILENNVLYFCDIIIKEEMRKTRIVYEFVKYVLTLKEFEDFNEIYFHVNKTNHNSLKTWAHFNLEQIDEGKNSNKYKTTRQNIETFLNKFNK